ncbi:MAG TPA: amidase family protein, partial [Solirubrobacterales bacterium]
MSQSGDELAFVGAARQAEMVRAGEVSATELVGLYLDRIQRLDPELNAFRKVFAEKAMLEAEQAEARVRAGEERPLLGVPIAIKDEVDVAGEINTHGTDGFSEPAKTDSEMVRRLREAGAIIIGLTLLPELAICGFSESATYGVTRNPWNPQRTPGGSSGGSAAAVAAGLVPIASAGDGAGSIRIPSASCGLFGLKPSRGRASLAPLPEGWRGMAVLGCVSRNVRDAALWLDVISGGSSEAEAPVPPERPFIE